LGGTWIGKKISLKLGARQGTGFGKVCNRMFRRASARKKEPKAGGREVASPDGKFAEKSKKQREEGKKRRD